MKILLIHGPNLNLLGSRETAKYGTETSENLVNRLKDGFPPVEIDYFQSNDEGLIVDKVQESTENFSGILINAGAYSHTSVAIADAIRSVQIPAICVHITPVFQREEFRHTDIVGDACRGSIVGLGTEGYTLAMECLLEMV